MSLVILRPFYHRDQECIAILFPFDDAVKQVVRKLSNIRWSKTHKCWWLPLDNRNVEKIKIALQKIALVDDEPLREYFSKKKQVIISPGKVDRRIERSNATLVTKEGNL